MVNACIGVLLIIGSSLMLLTGLSVFSRGFLLTRVSMEGLSAKTVCNQNWTDMHHLDLDIGDGAVSDCWLPAKFKRAVIMLIDGLRYDFVIDEPVAGNSKVIPQNRMPFLRKLLSEVIREENNETISRRAILYRFMADAPTTTMQRIKALITGGLPTFIDAGRNFESAEILEDNIVDGFVANGRKVIFMGDDTWMGLLPGRFQEAYPYPSFNVRDLHTVDNGVIEHLLPKLSTLMEFEATGQQPDWDLIIAHFLGVDHCGHIHGPNHPEMTKKLAQMSDIIRSVTDSLDNSTVLFVFGDHGMTRTGDHGGDSVDEITSALFIFSKNIPLVVAPKDRKQTDEVSQIDFVATFSLLLGIPIPFSNLGAVVSELFDDKRGYDVSALYLNVKQVHQFLAAYGAVSKDLSNKVDQMNNIEALLVEIEILWTAHQNDPTKQTSNLKSKCITYLRKVQRLCRDTWAKFDLPLIFTGLIVMAIAIFITYLLVISQLTIELATALGLCLVGFIGLLLSLHPIVLPNVQLSTFWDISLTISVALIYATLAIIFVFDKSCINITATKLDLFTTGAVILNAGLYFSNSYIVSEDSVTSFLLLTLLFGATIWGSTEGLSRATERSSGRKARSKLLKRGVCSLRVASVGAAFVAAVCVRIQRVFWKCREEQWWCVDSMFLLPSLFSIESDEHKSQRLMLCFVGVILTVIAIRWFLRRAGNLNGYSLTVMCITYFPLIMCLAICVYWTLVVLSSKMSAHVFSRHMALVPQLVLSTGLLGLLILLLKPLTIYEAPRNADEIEVSPDSGSIVPQVFRHLRANWQKHLSFPGVAAAGKSNSGQQQQQQPLVVYGLATAFSSVLFVSVTYGTLSMIVLSSDAYSISFHLLLVEIVAVLHCLALSRSNGSSPFDVPWCWVVIVSFLSSSGFYATGHQQTFPSVHWESAMIGTRETDHVAVAGAQLLPGLQIVANTFASTIIMSISLPIFIVCQSSKCTFFPSTSKTSNSEEQQNALYQGEFELVENPAFFNGLIRLCMKYLVVNCVRLFASMGAAALHRRHLMVWKIFAPRFLFEGVNFIVSIPAVLLGQLLVISVNRALREWVNQKTV